MEFILADQDRMELGILSVAASLDIDLSRDAENAEGTNDGQMTVTADEGIEYGMYIFSPGREFGGRILDLKRSTASESLISVSYTHLQKSRLMNFRRAAVFMQNLERDQLQIPLIIKRR